MLSCNCNEDVTRLPAVDILVLCLRKKSQPEETSCEQHCDCGHPVG